MGHLGGLGLVAATHSLLICTHQERQDYPQPPLPLHYGWPCFQGTSAASTSYGTAAAALRSSLSRLPSYSSAPLQLQQAPSQSQQEGDADTVQIRDGQKQAVAGSPQGLLSAGNAPSIRQGLQLDEDCDWD